MKIKILDGVQKRHSERLENVLKDSGLATDVKWTATVSDINKDRVYIQNSVDSEEYSVGFEDVDGGYNYYINKRMQLSDSDYNVAIKSNPSLKNIPRDCIATIVTIKEGFVESFIHVQNNSAYDFLVSADLERYLDGSEEEKLLIFEISSACGIHNTLIKVMIPEKEAVVEKMLSTQTLKSKVAEVASLSFEKTIHRLVLEADYELFIRDFEVELKARNYDVSF